MMDQQPRPEEKLLIVDENNVPTGIVKERTLIHQDSDWHRITAVYILNKNKEILCLERHRESDPLIFAGKWQPYVGGHIRHDETPIQNAIRELKEELGLMVFVANFKNGPVRRSEAHHVWIYTFIYKFSGKMEDFTFPDETITQITFLGYNRLIQSMQKETERWASRLGSTEQMRHLLT